MDIIKEKKRGLALAFTHKAVPYWIGAFVLMSSAYLLLRDNVRTLSVDGGSVICSEVISGEFNDYIRVRGQVQPRTTIQLSPLEEGVVEQIFVEEGARLKKGDRILQLSNENLDLQILNAEADLAEKENLLRNTMIQMEQQRLSVNQEKLQLGIDVERYKRTCESQRQLYREQLISKEDYLRAEEDYKLAKGKYELVKERSVQDSLYRSVQIVQMEESLKNMRLNMAIIRKRKENLVVTAPIDGELGLLDAVLGQSVARGGKIGQINNLDEYKIEAHIDEHYIDRIIVGLSASFVRGDETFSATVRKVYPEVRDGKFKADFKFAEHIPDNIRSGQTYDLNLQLGQPEKALLISRGAFYYTTGGKWIYVVAPDGRSAVRRQIEIGRQNPQYYEVIGGLQPGERVVISNYDNFGDNECLIFK